MGRYEYHCARCAQKIITKTQLNESQAPTHQLCAACAEATKEERAKEESAEEEKRTKAKR
jgi:predicted SprT family Zn-dependent metalloprotease